MRCCAVLCFTWEYKEEEEEEAKEKLVLVVEQQQRDIHLAFNAA